MYRCVVCGVYPTDVIMLWSRSVTSISVTIISLTVWSETVVDEVVEDASVGGRMRVLQVQAVAGTGYYKPLAPIVIPSQIQ